MEKIALDTLAEQQLDAARGADASRASETILGGHDAAMRQTLIALASGAELSEHVNPGQASLHVLTGEIEVIAGDDTTQVSAGEFVEIPDVAHSVRALTDAAMLLTAVPRAHID